MRGVAVGVWGGSDPLPVAAVFVGVVLIDSGAVTVVYRTQI